jgi:hypothetical protein
MRGNEGTRLPGRRSLDCYYQWMIREVLEDMSERGVFVERERLKYRHSSIEEIFVRQFLKTFVNEKRWKYQHPPMSLKSFGF